MEENNTWTSEGKKYADDRIPTLEELKQLVDYPDRRIKAIVYTMASSGIRVGAWDFLRWRHITPIEKNGEIIAAKMIVYGGEDDEYFTFMSPSAWSELLTWRQYREISGERINDDSWVMRNLWDTRVAQGRGLVTVPKKLTSLSVKRLMERAIWAQGLRKILGKVNPPFIFAFSFTFLLNLDLPSTIFVPNFLNNSIVLLPKHIIFDFNSHSDKPKHHFIFSQIIHLKYMPR